MKKLILIPLLLLLVSCGVKQTQEQKLQMQKDCADLWRTTSMSITGEVECSYRFENPVMKCIREYTNWLDEKYNNPDTVTNLREDNYSSVVETCNKIFWD